VVFNNRKPRTVRPLSKKDLDKLVEEFGGVEKIMEDFAHHNRDVDFFENHGREFLEKYPNEWVAVYNEEIVGTNKDFFVLLNLLEKKGLTASKAIVHFMDTDPKPLILSKQGVAI